MKIKTINQVDDFTYPWTKALLAELLLQKDSEIVGERLLLENEKCKVWSIHLPVGQSLPFHKHSKPYFYTAITKGKSRSFYADGKVVETIYEVNDITYFNDLNNQNYFTHNLENIGKNALIFTTVEFK